MSWLSTAVGDVGKDLTSFWDNDLKPALENPIVDVGLGLGATALTAGLAGPAIGGLLGFGDAALAGAGAGSADLAGGAAGLGDWLGTTDFGATLGGGGTGALGLAGDVAATDIPGFPALSDTGSLALNSELGGNVLPGGAGADWSVPSLGLSPSDLTTGAAAPANLGAAASSGGGDLGVDATGTPLTGYEGAVPSPANPQAGGQFGIQPTGAAAQPQSILSNITSALTGPTAKAVGTVAGLGGLGYNLYSGYEQKQQLNTLANQEAANAATVAQNAATAQSAAGPALSQGQLLTQYLTTGTLPQTIQAQVDQQVAATKAQIIQGYGARGMSTNPQQNSALAQDLANVDTQKESLMGTLEQNLATAGQQMISTATSLLNAGTSATQLAANIPIMMQNLDIQLAQVTSQSISSFAAALNGKSPVGQGTTINLQGATVS